MSTLRIVIATLATLLALAGPGPRNPKTNPVAPPAATTVLPTATPAPISSSPAALLAETVDCPNPPPWSTRAEAERCWRHYPPPFGRVIVEGCQLGYSPLGDLICYGYWLVPGAVYPLLTAPPPATAQPTGYPPPYP